MPITPLLLLPLPPPPLPSETRRGQLPLPTLTISPSCGSQRGATSQRSGASKLAHTLATAPTLAGVFGATRTTRTLCKIYGRAHDVRQYTTLYRDTQQSSCSGHVVPWQPLQGFAAPAVAAAVALLRQYACVLHGCCGCSSISLWTCLARERYLQTALLGVALLLVGGSRPIGTLAMQDN